MGPEDKKVETEEVIGEFENGKGDDTPEDVDHE